MTTAANVTLIPAKRDTLTGSGNGVITKVAAYCRVSTEQENQQNSYATQISYYTNYITRNPDWQLVGIYADEGISGTSLKKRDQFNAMIADCRAGKIDLIKRMLQNGITPEVIAQSADIPLESVLSYL